MDTYTTDPLPRQHHRMFLTCYEDTLRYGWHHVDLFIHDQYGREVNWVHYEVKADGPEAADELMKVEEPSLVRTSPWQPSVSAAGVNYWTADADWQD